MWKVSKCGVFSGRYFPAFGLNTERYFVSSVFSSNAGKYGPENTPYLDIFHAVQDYLWECENQRTDVNRYDKVEGDLFTATNKNICKVLGNIIRKKEIDKKRANSLYIKRPQLCRFYLLPKIHKKNNKCTRKTCYFQ